MQNRRIVSRLDTRHGVVFHLHLFADKIIMKLKTKHTISNNHKYCEFGIKSFPPRKRKSINVIHKSGKPIVTDLVI